MFSGYFFIKFAIDPRNGQQRTCDIRLLFHCWWQLRVIDVSGVGRLTDSLTTSVRRIWRAALKRFILFILRTRLQIKEIRIGARVVIGWFVEGSQITNNKERRSLQRKWRDWCREESETVIFYIFYFFCKWYSHSHIESGCGKRMNNSNSNSRYTQRSSRRRTAQWYYDARYHCRSGYVLGRYAMDWIEVVVVVVSIELHNSLTIASSIELDSAARMWCVIRKHNNNNSSRRKESKWFCEQEQEEEQCRCHCNCCFCFCCWPEVKSNRIQWLECGRQTADSLHPLV